MIKAILLDIEGTTTPIDFVHKTLFPFAKARLDEFVAAHFGELRPEIEQLEIEYHRDFQNQIYGRAFNADAPESIANYLKFLIDVDRKSTPLKNIQGRIWQSGYESGTLASHLFPDVAPAFVRWAEQGRTVAIFSSGSVLAQKLIFKYSDAGDLSPFIANYFDTTTGAKKEPESYRRIARDLRTNASEILFISDVPAELDAAREAELQTVLSIREGNGIVRHPTHHDAVASFGDLGI
ncbi:MAG: acireductone synthase [Acidobacteria bacterium]|nr:acireductone synthase [Acidobacteriota bacterium]